ncbi:MAG: hypothetical protein E5V62_03215 [Mesorhizobium sp.]|uniref:hypothetical protein n=1 Tax=Mesorhizobium sp. TaxID=1871066 RepID=UPI000FD4C3F1|nr:hypothetical protein [Mesorhizobium sp.]RVD69858.1 hypothetical protein EN751_23775 [Mesorhizobium sp. M4A.F.Ca.ET.029.04.2.1]TIW37173.1 MAG: hypothetical protein E5V62_03215 [Mesorhizobium sp.]
MTTYCKTRGASQYLREQHGIQRAPATLETMRTKGGGPAFVKLGGEVYYATEALDHWVEQKLSKPVYSTSELPGRSNAA